MTRRPRCRPSVKTGEIVMQQRFIGKNILVTGASTGIGRAIAVRLAQEGGNIAVNYSRNDVEAGKTAERVRAAHDAGGYANAKCSLHKADVSQEQPVNDMIDGILADWGRLDVLINNAGIQKPAASHESLTEDFDRILGVNLRGCYLCSRAAIRHFLSREGGGAIVNNSSVHEIIPKPKYLSYSISKGGMENLTKSLALEYADRGIRVNAVGPGAIVTPINMAWIDDPRCPRRGREPHPDGQGRRSGRNRRGICLSGLRRSLVHYRPDAVRLRRPDALSGVPRRLVVRRVTHLQ